MVASARICGLVVLAAGIVGQTNSAAFASGGPGARLQASTTISILPGSAPPLTIAEVKGSGFDPSSAADVFFDTGDLALAVADGVGNIDIKIQIPQNAQPGTHYVTVEERETNRAAQTQYVVSTSWPMWGFGQGAQGYNPYENSIDTNNVNSLLIKWAAPAGGLGNASPFATKDGLAYVGDVFGFIHAYNSGGQLQWSAHPGTDLESITPAVYGNHVFFGDYK